MSRMTTKHVGGNTANTTRDCKSLDGRNLIAASDSEILVASGYCLAIVDDKGNIVRKGACVGTEIFNAMASQVIKSFCKKFRGFTESDFVKPN